MRPSWDDYFMEIAQIVSKRSTCLRRQYGAVIVNNNLISSTGYNGSKRKAAANCCDSGVCVREQLKVPKGERYELCVAVHAEMNAIINGDPAKICGGTIYVAGFNSDGTTASSEPCLLCSRVIANALIARIVYLDENGDMKSLLL